jgi:hypothetical protein
MRTTRLPSDASGADFCRPVFLEIRRTIAAVQNKLHGRRVASVWFCGDGPSQQSLAEMAKAELDLPIELFDPFTAFELSGELQQRLPDYHSRFAPLLGMLADAVAGDRHAIDFLEPRRRPPPKSRQRELAIGIACAAVLLLGFLGWTWWRMQSLDSEIAHLQSRYASLDGEIKKNKSVKEEAADLNKWLDRNVNWLDELHRLSVKGPKGELAMLTGLRGDIDRKKGGGTLTLDVLAADAQKVQQQIRDVYANTSSPGYGESDGKIKRYGWKFQTESSLKSDGDEGKAKQAPPRAGVKPGPVKTVKSAATTKKGG